MVKSGFVTMETINKRKRSVEKIIGERLALKDARRAYGQRLLDCGNQVEDVSVMMGHASTKTTSSTTPEERSPLPWRGYTAIGTTGRSH